MARDSSAQFRQINRERFDAFAGYCRSPLVIHLAHELAWFESDGGDILATLVVDTDREFSGIVFARDLQERFRWVNQTSYFGSAEEAVTALVPLATQTLERLDVERVQGDEAARPIDFFVPLVADDRLHPDFKRLAAHSSHKAARNLVRVLMRWYEDRDGNYVQQFQTDGFDARIWELYLWATLVSLDYAAEFPDPAPDIVAVGVGVRFALEATTVNPSMHEGQLVPAPKPTSVDEAADYFRNYLPIRFAGPLTAKLDKKYWERTAVAGLPFVLAIQDFHADFSMTYSGAALPSYLYGLDLVGFGGDEDDDDAAPPRPISAHHWKGKSVDSGFFSLPGAENVSALIFNASGTLSKFNRMGIKVGLGTSRVRVLHAGERLVAKGDDLTEAAFSEEVLEDYGEAWVDGMEVYHNPRALHPLDPTWLPGAAHHRLTSDGCLESLVPDGHLITSRTAIVTGSARRPTDME